MAHGKTNAADPKPREEQTCCSCDKVTRDYYAVGHKAHQCRTCWEDNSRRDMRASTYAEPVGRAVYAPRGT